MAAAIASASLLTAACGAAPGKAAPQEPRPRPRAIAGVPDGAPHPGAQGMVQVTLPVRKVPTQFAVENGVLAPQTVTVTIPAAWRGDVGAYWAGVVILGPAGWTGSAAFGADGSGFVNLHPPGASAGKGPRVAIQTAGACVGCGDGLAAQYFAYVAEHWSEFQVVAGPPPQPVRVLSEVSLSPNLLAYRMPDAPGGLDVNGVAYTGFVNHASGLPFVQMNVALPASDHSLATIVLNYFIAHDLLRLP